MKALLVHLSDLHYSAAAPIDPKRFQMLGAPVPPLLHEKPDLVALLIGGDLVDRGEIDSFPAIAKLIGNAKASLEANLPSARVIVAVVPGNHDSDFKMEQDARNVVLIGIGSRKEVPSFSGSLADTLLAPQEAFFKSTEQLVSDCPPVELVANVDRRIAWRHEVDEFPAFGLTCLNSALLTKRREDPGGLLLPSHVAFGSRALEVVLVHHPLNWLDAWNAKELRKRLHESHRIILTGHEHRADILESNLAGSGTAVNVEAPLFASGNSEILQGFSAVYYDTEEATHQEFQFMWESDGYVPYFEGTRVESGQVLMPLATFARSTNPASEWQFTQRFEEDLEKTDLLFSRDRVDSLNLSDIFEFPDIRELTHQSEYQKSRHVAGEKLCDELQERPIIFILGPDQSGKTALSKRLMKVLLAKGKIPLLSQGKRHPPDVRNYRAHLNELCEEQFGRQRLGHFGNAPLQDKVLLIDNYQDSPKRAKAEHRILKMVNQHCSQVIVFCEETDLSPLDLANFALESNLKISVMIIQPMGVPSQRKLAERWLSLDPDLVANREQLAVRMLEAMRLLGAIVGRGYIQPYPSYVLAVLQSIDAGQPVDVTASTHGHLYEAFIKAALAKRRSMTNHNILTSFVSYLAYRMFRDNEESCSDEYLKERHAEWSELTDLSRSEKSLVNDLLELRFLRSVAGLYRFGEKFVFYYFIAFWIKDRMGEADVREAVSECVRKVWVDDYANVLLFLAHLSRDGSVVDELIKEADSYFPEQAPAELRGSINLEGVELIEDSEPEPEEGRPEELEAVAEEQGLQEMSVRLNRKSGRCDLDYLGQLCAAVKVLQILGQFVKNFPANFTPQKKTEIVEKCVGIGLRTLGSSFELIGNAQEEILEEFSKLLCQKDSSQKEEAKRGAEVALANLCLINSFGVIKRISNAIGSRELDRTYRRVFEAAPDVPSWKLVEISLKLDHTGDFPDTKVKRLHDAFHGSDDFAQRLLRKLVARHFRLFEVGYRIRQSISDHMKISLKSSLGPINREKIAAKRNI